MTRSRMTQAQRREQLLDIAEQLFTTLGYDNVSIEDVAREAGITRAVIYQHHGSKEGLLLAAVERARDEFEAALAGASELAGDELAVFVEQASILLFDMLEQRPLQWALLFSSAVGETNRLARDLSLLRFETIEHLASLAARYAPELDRQHIEAFAVAASGMAESIGRWWLYKPELPRETVVAYFRDFLTATITTTVQLYR